MTKNIFYLLLLLITFNSCKKNQDNQVIAKTTIFHFAKNVLVDEDENRISITSNGNKVVFEKKDLPLKNIMVETSSAISFLDQFNQLDIVTGVYDVNFIYNPKIAELIKNKKILDIGNSNEIYLELILKNKPQVIITNSNPVLAKFHQQLEQNGIKILYLDEYKEQDPLAQVEYLKIFGKLLNKDKEADEIVNNVSKSYDSIKNIISNNANGNVSTLVNTMYGDVWYLPTKDLLQAKLIDDAKGNYVFNNKLGNNSLALTFEEVYKKGKEAKYWINVSNVNSLSEMKASYPNYSWFDAFKNGNVYAYNKRVNAKGSNDYYEQGIVRPDIILNDLGKIFYPELFPNYTLYFYQQLK